MKQNKPPILLNELEDECLVSEQIYNPLVTFSCDKLRKENKRIQSKTVFCKLLTFGDQGNPQLQNSNVKIKETQEHQGISQDQNLKKILQKTKQNDNVYFQNQSFKQIQPHSFNFDLKFTFNQTPIFKCLLQTPLRIFNKNYSFEIQQLYGTNFSTQKFQQIKRKQNPCLYISKAATFFIGIAKFFQNSDNFYQALFFYNLAIYVEPFNQKVWEEAISYVKKIGFWKKAYIWAKTAFLFIPCSQFADQLLLCGDRSQVPMNELRGLLSSLRNPQKYQKSIIESAKFEMKNRRLWRGISLLNKFCALSNYKPALSYSVILLARCLQGIGYYQYALQVLQKSIQKGINKFQAYYTYIEIKLRLNYGQIQDRDIKFLDSHTENLTLESRYRLSLCLAQVCIKKRNRKYEQYIKKSCNLAQKHCKGTGKQRSFRQIYFTLSNALNICPKNKLIELFKNDQNLIFQFNKHKYLNGQPMIKYPFKNWKYYLHLALLKDPKILIKAFQQNNQGRLIAQAIHVLRLSTSPLYALKFWREKIDQLPKSGELWCQGGRIYLNLDEKENAMKCFQYAIHFTPQFGDSFIELLKVYLSQGSFVQANQLRKNFQMSEPYYGNVLSFLELKQSEGFFRCNLRKVWQLAIQEINYTLYSNSSKYQLTACSTYNESLKNPINRTIREVLFSSYQQIQNKIVRT